jgi:hypothetical protein
MKLVPRRGWVIGRIAITKVSEMLVAPNATSGVTKFALLDLVSPEAEAAGFRPGDLVMARTMHNIFLKGGTYHRVTFPFEEVICIVHDVALDELIGSDGKPIQAKEIAA